MLKAQSEDAELSQLIKIIQKDRQLSKQDKETASEEMLCYYREYSKLFLNGSGLLESIGGTSEQIVLPKKFKTASVPIFT